MTPPFAATLLQLPVLQFLVELLHFFLAHVLCQTQVVVQVGRESVPQVSQSPELGFLVSQELWEPGAQRGTVPWID